MNTYYSKSKRIFLAVSKMNETHLLNAFYASGTHDASEHDILRVELLRRLDPKNKVIQMDYEAAELRVALECLKHSNRKITITIE